MLACWQPCGQQWLAQGLVIARPASLSRASTCPALQLLQDAVGTARDKERRKRRVGQPLLVPGLCLPKALQPVLPIYLQGVLQVRCRAAATTSCLPGCMGPDLPTLYSPADWPACLSALMGLHAPLR